MMAYLPSEQISAAGSLRQPLIREQCEGEGDICSDMTRTRQLKWQWRGWAGRDHFSPFFGSRYSYCFD